MRRLLREQEKAGAIPAALTIYATRIPVPARTLTGLTAAVQLRLRVATGLQALQRCSGLLNRRARGSTVATHNFMPAWLSSDSSSFVNCRALPHESASLSIGPISASVVKLQSSSASNGEFAGGSGLASKKRRVKSSHLVNCFWLRSQLGTGN